MIVSVKSTYEVVATRIDRWWGLTVPDVPGALSQVRSLDEADAHAREAVALVLGAEPDWFDLRIEPSIGVQLPTGFPSSATEAVSDLPGGCLTVWAEAPAA